MAASDKMETKQQQPVDEVSIKDLFDQFIEASTMRNVLATHRRIMDYADLSPCEFNDFFPKLKRAVLANRQRKNWKAKALFSKIDKRATQRCYSNTKPPTPSAGTNNHHSATNSDSYNVDNQAGSTEDSMSSSNNLIRSQNYNNALQDYNCLIIGSGPAGLRTAIELQLLGAKKVVIVEKRGRFSRNNVLHLWPFVIDDLKSLGAKKFYGKFCAGSIDHISIRQLQLMLLKVCLMIGCDFRDSCSYLSLCPATIKQYNDDITKTTPSDEEATQLEGDSCDKKENDDYSQCDIEQMQVTSVSVPNSSTRDKQQLSIRKEGQNDEDNKENSTKPHLTSAGSSPNNDDCSDFIDIDADEPSSVKLKDINSTTTTPPPPRQTASCDKLRGAKAHFECESKSQEKELHSYGWDIIIGADGRRNTLSKFFPRKEFRGRLAIAITANFINRQTTTEAAVPEISGLSFIYNQDMFNALAYDTNIQLENVCYYKDDTHYFVMTAKKKSLLERGVLINDYAATQDLLSDNNVNRDALLKYAKDAAFWTTGMEPLDFALNHYGQEDCAMFDFTSMYAASNACKALRTRRGGLTLVGLVGDSLLEPFWPTGSGCARGFLSSFDAAWMCRQWAVNKCAIVDYHQHAGTGGSSRASRNRSSTAGSGRGGASGQQVEPTTYNRMALSVMAERESIYRILAQTTSENLQQNYSHWTLNPHTRYPNLNRHLVVPSQVEHLMTDCEARYHQAEPSAAPGATLAPPGAAGERGRRIKSPNARKSPKKLKSANASPISHPRNHSNRSKSLSKYMMYKSRSRPDNLNLSDDDEDSHVDTYLEFEESYRNLVERERPGGMNQYLSHRRPDCDLYDDLFVPSISGTLPSSNNLLNLEARRARDIDECLRQRRQKTKINIVREQLVGRFRAESEGPGRQDGGKSPGLFGAGGNAVLFSELRKLREQQARGGSSRPDCRSAREISSGPLSLLNSMRRCASFAERVKSFESKFSSDPSSDQTEPPTPKTPIHNVRNLPQFATLQELFVNNVNSPTANGECKTDKSKHYQSRIPVVSKLTKDDWNVKCWEKRLAAANGKVANGSGRSALGKSLSVDDSQTRFKLGQRPKKQVDIFQDRIKEMAEKLEIAKENNKKLYQEKEEEATNISSKSSSQVRSQGWINHLKRELSRGVEAKNIVGAGGVAASRKPMNPAVPNKPIKKLFEDDDDEDDGIDVNKHYDHLCVNRPKNKYLSKGGAYKSHLVRTKLDSSTSRVINRPNPTGESKQAYLAALASRASSTSSTRSDYSTNTANSSSGSGKQAGSQPSVIDVECFRCHKFVSTSDRITVASATLHRACLTCASCGITLRSNEIQHYLDSAKEAAGQAPSFTCAICKPSIRAELSREAAHRLAQAEERRRDSCELSDQDDDDDEEEDDAAAQYQSSQQMRMQSREDFLNARIDYSELYKNIITSGRDVAVEPGDGNSKIDNTTSQTPPPTAKYVAPSPVHVTLPLATSVDGLASASQPASRASNTSCDSRQPKYRIARSETIDDGSEQVTLVLANTDVSAASTRASSSNNNRNTKPREMIDEEELERILHLDNQSKGGRRDSSSSASSVESSSSSSDDRIRHIDSGGAGAASAAASRGLGDGSDGGAKQSDDSSSLNSPPVSDDDDDDEHSSTYGGLVTSEEFEESTSDKEARQQREEDDDDEDDDDDNNGEDQLADNPSTTTDGPREQQRQLPGRTGKVAT